MSRTRPRRTTLPLVAFVAALLPPSPSLAGVTVRFVNPQSYTDAGSPGDGTRDATLAEFRKYLERLGGIFLAPGQDLRIEVLNIDLAGKDELLARSLSEARVMRDITPPSFRFRYVLTAEGRRMRSGEENLTNLFYQTNASARTSGQRYAYDKALLDDWFRLNFPRTR
jgi:Protein of unknown function (DUF3016)